MDKKNNGTFSQISKNIKLLKKEGVEFNILTVINKLTAQNGKLIYNFYKNNGFRYFQFIPCLDALYDTEKKILLLQQRIMVIF